MNHTYPPEFEIPLDDDEAERLLDKASALIHRHESFAIASDPDDLPVLTDVVDERIEPFIANPVAALTPDPSAPTADISDSLVALESAISRHIEDWVANELPQIMSRELDGFAEHLRSAALIHMRGHLLPILSAQIAHSLDSDKID